MTSAPISASFCSSQSAPSHSPLLIVGLVAHLVVPSLPWAACFALGAIVSPPDAVAAKAVLQGLRLPRRVTVLLEGESLVNDASGLVLFRLAVAASLTGTFNAGSAALSFVVLAIGGVAAGLVLGLVASVLLKRVGARIDHRLCY